MERFNVKSIVLGIGIGIVITSFISIIYLAGNNPKIELSNEEIVKKALQLGMVKAEDMVKDNTYQQEQNKISVDRHDLNKTSESDNHIKTTKISDDSN